MKAQTNKLATLEIPFVPVSGFAAVIQKDRMQDENPRVNYICRAVRIALEHGRLDGN